MVPWLCGRFREILPEPGRNLQDILLRLSSPAATR